MGSFAFDLKNEKKTLNVMVEGMFTPQNAQDFVTEYQRNVEKIKSIEYSLEFDATNLKVSTQEMLPMLENCMKMYKATGFNNISFQMGTSVIVKNQLKKIIERVGLENCLIL